MAEYQSGLSVYLSIIKFRNIGWKREVLGNKKDFNNVILFDIKKWIKAQINKPDTALLGVEELVVEWNRNEHLFPILDEGQGV